MGGIAEEWDAVAGGFPVLPPGSSNGKRALIRNQRALSWWTVNFSMMSAEFFRELRVVIGTLPNVPSARDSACLGPDRGGRVTFALY